MCSKLGVLLRCVFELSEQELTAAALMNHAMEPCLQWLESRETLMHYKMFCNAVLVCSCPDPLAAHAHGLNNQLCPRDALHKVGTPLDINISE